MTGKDAIRYQLKSNYDFLKMYLGDLSDADILERAVPKANHIAWQLGHLIKSEGVDFHPPIGAVAVKLPEGFDKQHSKEASSLETGFFKKEEYLDLFHKVRAATFDALERIPESELDKPSPVYADFIPTIGAIFITIANHDMMHAGQFTVLRRKLGKPVLF